MSTNPPRTRAVHLLAAFASGGLLTAMVFLNGESARHGGALFSSWLAHGTGTVVALSMLALLWRRPKSAPVAARAPLWAYLGGLSGAATVMLTSTTVNTALALAGTLALGLAGQVGFGLLADRWGLFGLPRRRLTGRDGLAVVLIAGGSLLIILLGRAA